MATTFRYQPLADSEIRLISFTETSLAHKQIECTIENAPLGESLRFYALSYVWGDPTDRLEITLQGIKFNITKNLFHALHQLREWVKEGLFDDEVGAPKFWADAICINQDDLDEKAQQVPRMKDIYSSAILVYGWLGLPDDLEDRVVGQVFRKATEIASHPRAGDAQWLRQYPIKDELGEDYGPFTKTFLSIIQRPWFRRIWIIQECILAKTDPLFVIGSHYTNALSGLSMIYSHVLAKVGDPQQELIVRSNLGPLKILRLRLYYKSLARDDSSQETSRLTAFANRLNRILRDATLGYSSTLPHDRIYALLGMASDGSNLPASLAPDYQKPFPQVCYEYAKFLIEHTRDLSILSKMESGLDPASADAPIWVPDFRFPRLTVAEPASQAVVTFSPDSRALTVQGAIIGQCVAVLQPTAPGSDPELKDLLRRFEAGILRPASEITEREFKEVFISWLETYTDPDGPYPINIATMRAVYGYLLGEPRINLSEIDEDAKKEMISREMMVKIGAGLHTHLGLYAQLLAADGTIAQLDQPHFLVMPGDILCVFRGSVKPSLLRPRGTQYELLGTCRTRWSPVDEVYDDGYFARRQTTAFTLA